VITLLSIGYTENGIEDVTYYYFKDYQDDDGYIEETDITDLVTRIRKLKISNINE
jgi:hypothetical protein